MNSAGCQAELSGVLMATWLGFGLWAEAGTHWAFEQVRRPSVPRVENAAWLATPVDAFILAQQEKAHLSPSQPAKPAVLLRRLYLDLVGFPPSAEAVERFEHDVRPVAYAEAVEGLLASPHFGERWGRHWLDVARYADSGGYEADLPRTAWRYRDYVIGALNQNLPFDQFVEEQLAGDLLPGATEEQRIATAFHANNMLDGNLPWEANIDRVSTTATVFLGLTVGCAQCHDHKTDPISTREFYQLYAFFNEAANDELSLATPADRARRDSAQLKIKQAEEELEDHRRSRQSEIAAWATQLTSDQRRNLPASVRSALESPAATRTREQVQAIEEAFWAQDTRAKDLSLSLERLKAAQPQLPVIPVLSHRTNETRMFLRGNPETLGAPVQAGFPAALSPPDIGAGHSLTRRDLARWLMSPQNPLTARVTVNRIWQQYFGRGLVETENDFGIQTPRPLHQPLLDWLAAEFMSSGWNVKHIHRLLVSSSTYRQSSRRRSELDRHDPGNTLVARQHRSRLEAETIRDSALVVSGLIEHRIGGPSVFPHQPEGVLDFRATKAEWVKSQGADQYRRGLYTWFWRLTPYPFLTLFDAPDAFTTQTQRTRSNTPTQALTLLNDPVFLEAAQALAARVLEDGGVSTSDRIRYAIRRCLGRSPTSDEIETLEGLLEEQTADFRSRPGEAARFLGREFPESEGIERAAWTVVSRALLNLDEFISRE
ncbi:MAG: DUF1553 domain-containing protein [Verrucomicrobia bacterium]|nr:DUF1553 domain-containing protein [Verrucomicrobiota bacterium]